MAHKVKVNGTVYDVVGGKTKVGGTAYDINKGRTLVSGTGQDISFIPSPLQRVGGRIFYIHNDNGQQYRFFTQNMTEITNITVSGLSDAYWYWRSGTPSTDKFYVYDNTSHTYSYQGGSISIIDGITESVMHWGFGGTAVGALYTSIGGGKKNTNIVLSRGIPAGSPRNIFGYIKYCRDNTLSGCNDWFIASNDEQKKLKVSGLVDWYITNKWIWSSLEANMNNANYWQSTSFDTGDKDMVSCACFACRSF